MKKLIVGVLVTLMLMLSFGCSSEEITPPTSVTPDKTEQSTPALVPTPEQTTEPAPAPEAEPEPEVEEVAIEEVEIYNENNIVVTATKIEEDWMGCGIAVTVKNGSSKNIIVSTDMLSVNGYMMDGGMYCDVAAGKNAMDSISLYSSGLDQAGIDTIAEVEFYLNVINGDTFETVDVSDLIKISTTAADGFEQPVDDSGDEIYNANDVRVVCKGIKDEIIWDGAVVFYFENNSSRSVSIYSENVSVNDFMAEVSLWEDMRPGTKAVDGMYMYDLASLGIETIDDIDKVELSIRIVDEGNWEEIGTSDPIVLEFTAE